MISSIANETSKSFKELTQPRKTDIFGYNRYHKRLQIVTFKTNGFSNSEIGRFVECDIKAINRWESRNATGNGLQYLQRSGRPPVYTEDIQLKTIGFYCQMAPLPGCNSWSLRDAEDYLKTHDEILGNSLSYSSIRRILNKHSLRPHLWKYFLNITDPDFFHKMEHMIDLNLHPPDNLNYFDECTCLQAKAPLAPDSLAEPGLENREEFQYKRNGTTDLLAFLNRKTGKVFGRCTPNHNTETLIDIFKEHVYTFSRNEQIHYVMDNLSPHFNDLFCDTVAKLSKERYVPLKTGQERREWLQKEDKRIVIHFTPFHGSWLNMIEIWFGILGKKCLKHRHFNSLGDLKIVIMDFIETWNTHWAHPFDWKYTGEGLIEKVMNRFNKLLLIESAQMDITFLRKQLSLMFNISQDYPGKLKTDEWLQFSVLFNQKTDYIHKIIHNEQSDLKRSKAVLALENLKLFFSAQ